MPPRSIYSSLVDVGLALVTPHLARKKAFLIGIKAREVYGSHQDIRRFRDLLIGKFGFQSSDIIIMLDDEGSIQPTKVNITAALQTFLLGQRPGDLFVFAYAGHAKQVICRDGSERDNMDESIITCDELEREDAFRTILDDVLHNYLVKPLAPGCTLVAFLDSCHSETLLDLKHHVCNRPALPRRILRRARELIGIPGAAVATTAMRTNRFCSGFCPRINIPSATPKVICFSACKDSETIFEAEGYSMLNTIIGVLEKEPSPKLETLRSTLGKSAREIYRRARSSNQGRRTDDEKEMQPGVVRWAPQISSMEPLQMQGRLKL
ncbi:caspase domain-containing protein [Mycena albidolilacea]|uniref:Caspase domain-containing protein n=1 Tax=Mycena albidolilacea TaxID=1033008 RepID=A0AAD6ZVK1_9AGAR|nr:caspase domain-containing protein [Mycena albidolilacea]